MLPAPYFLLTFTLPAELRPFARQQQRLFYDLLFRASAAATQQLAQDPRFIGGQVGMVGVLHTWTRDLRFHPHVHYLAPAGGLAAEAISHRRAAGSPPSLPKAAARGRDGRGTNGGQTWLAARKNFLLPVKALSRPFRGHFRQALRKTPAYAEVPVRVWTHAWVVHCKPVGSGQTALKYLAPYIFRVALSNRRLVGLVDGRVTFRYRESKTGQTRCCTLPVEAFIHRFLQHVLPRGFVKVRYYGLFAPGLRQRLAAVQQHLAQLATETPDPGGHDAPSPSTQPLSIPGRSEQAVRCPGCGQAMRVSSRLPPSARCPP